MLNPTTRLCLKLYENHFRFLARTTLRRLGFRKDEPVDPPPLVDDVEEALENKDAQFWCPIDLCLCENARAFGRRR